MSTTITIPELGEGVDSVDVVTVLVEVGDTIEVDQPLIEVETDKAAVEVPSTAAGTITEIHVSEGDTLGPDAKIVTVDEAEEGSTAKTPSREDEETSEEKAEEGKAEAETEGEAESGTETKSESESAAEAEAEPEAEPASASESESASDDTGKESDPGSDQDRPPSDDSRLASDASSGERSSRERKIIPAAPSVRRFAREVGLDIATVEGSGPGGRISIDDVKAEASRRLSRGAAPGGAIAAPSAELPDFTRWGEVRRESMSKVRKLTAEAMSRAWLTAPQVTNHDLADITELEELRQSYKARVEQAGGKLTMTAILVKIAASALKVFPSLNASVDADAEEIVFKDYVNIGVAVDTEHGLLVPVIKNADEKNITEIAVELGDLASRARDRKLKPDEMQGGTFSISNLGGIGGTGFSPIVNWPEVAILGVSRGSVRPEWDHELSDFIPRLVLPLSLSYDHRLVDGAEAARFLRWYAEALESPLLLALEG